MRLLCLDLGTKTGWASFDGARIESGVQNFAFNPRYEGGGMRFLKFQKWMNEMYALTAFERLAFEEVQQRPASVAAGHVYGGFLGHLTAWCEQHCVPYEGVPVGTIKKSLTGGGKATKEDMKRWIVSKGHKPADDNEADALAILYWLIEHAASRSFNLRPTPDRQPQGRVQVVHLPLRRRPTTN